jgi:hypothetical protein
MTSTTDRESIAVTPQGTAPPGVTQLAPRRTAASIAANLKALAIYIRVYADEDAAQIGIRPLPVPSASGYLLPLLDGDEDERRAKVDAFAERHGVTAAWDGATRSYRATVWIGELRYAAYAYTQADADEIREWAERRKDDLLAGVREDREALAS